MDSEFVTYGQLLTDAMFPHKKIFPNTPKTTFSNPDFHGGFEYKLCFYVRFQISSQITLLTDVTDGQIKTLTGDYKLLLSDRPPIFIANIAEIRQVISKVKVCGIAQLNIILQDKIQSLLMDTRQI